MSFLNETYSEQTHEEITSRSNAEIIQAALCDTIREADGRNYLLRMESLRYQREIHKLRKELKELKKAQS